MLYLSLNYAANYPQLTEDIEYQCTSLLGSESPSIRHASTVCMHPEEREGGSGLCRHIKAAAVRYSNMPCRTSLFTATPGRKLKQSAAVHSPCFICPMAKYSCFEEFCFLYPSCKISVYTSGRCCWKEIIIIAALWLIAASCNFYFELCLLLWGTSQLRVDFGDSKVYWAFVFKVK